MVAAGCDVIKVNPKLPLPERLLLIYNEINKVVQEYEPDIAVVETIFYGKNIKSAFTLGHVRGIILLALQNFGAEIAEYSPREVKKSVVGNGNASKEQVKFMVTKITKQVSDSEDATDALAIALCHFNKIKFLIKQR